MKKSVRTKRYSTNILALVFILFNTGTCDEKIANNNFDCTDSKLSNYFLLQLGCNRDTVAMGDTVILSLNFKNITDSILKFYPKTRMLLLQEPFYFVSPEATCSKLFSDTINIDQYVKIRPKESFCVHSKMRIADEDLKFYKRGNNRLYLMFFYDNIFLSKWKKATPKRVDFIYCSYLKSNEITLFIK